MPVDPRHLHPPRVLFNAAMSPSGPNESDSNEAVRAQPECSDAGRPATTRALSQAHPSGGRGLSKRVPDPVNRKSGVDAAGTEGTPAKSVAAAAGGLIEIGGGEALSLRSRPANDVAMPDAGSQGEPVGGVNIGSVDRGGEGRGSSGRGGGVTGSNRIRSRVPDGGRGMRDRIISKTRRGPKQTAFQRRYLANRPTGYHPVLQTWDLLPVNTRSSFAGEERSIFRTRGLLVSRFDFSLYHSLGDYNTSALASVFPSPPLWWPADWGNLPITLPWEVTLHRAELVRAGPDDAIWAKVYQRFLEQTAAGWDLYYSQALDKTTLLTLPMPMARAIIKAGAFSFCSSPTPSASFRKFVQLHSLEEDEAVANQRVAKARAWKHVHTLQSESESGNQTRTTGTEICECKRDMSRALRRLGFDAQILEAAGDDTSISIGSSVEKLVALSNSTLTFAISSDELLSRLDNLLSARDRSYFDRKIEEAFNAVRGARGLADFLNSRFSLVLSRLSSGR